MLLPEGIDGGEAPIYLPEEATWSGIGYVPHVLKMLVSRRA